MAEREIHLRDYLRVIRKRRRAAISFFILVLVISILVTYTATPTYMASTKLLIEKVEPYTIIDYRYVAHDPEFNATQYQLIRSRLVAEKVVSSLMNDPQSADLLRKEFSRPPSLLRKLRMGLSFGKKPDNVNKDQDIAGADKGLMDAAAQAISGSIMVQPYRDTKIVEVMYVSTSPLFASTVVNKIAEAYMEALFEMRMQTSGQTLQWISEQVTDERVKLEESEKVLQEYMREHDIITLEDRITILPQKLSDLGSELTKAEAKRKALEGIYEMFKALPKTLDGAENISVVSADNIVSELRKQLIENERKASELSKKYGPKHPIMIEIRNETNLLKRKVREEIGRVIKSVKVDYDLSMLNENNLRNYLSETKQEVLEVNEKFVQYSVLKRNVDTNRQIFDSLLKRMGEQSINEEIQSVKVNHYEKAQIPRAPYKPNKTFNLLFGLLLGALGGIGTAFFLDYFDNTVKGPDELEERTGVPVIGMVSLMRRKGKDEEEKRIETIVMDEPRSNFAESFKAIRTAIMLSSAEAPPNTILVTSMGPAEGKTSMSINLAIAISQLKKKVLLLDCDLRKPRIHRIFDLDNSRGISTYLAGDDSEIVNEVYPGSLYVATSGPIPPDPSELIGSRRFDEFIQALRKKYDVLIVDSSPVMSISDSLVLGSKMDSTIIVARAGKTTYELVSKGLKALKDLKAHTLGIIINAIEVRKGDYYYYKYYHYYSYGESEVEKK